MFMMNYLNWLHHKAIMPRAPKWPAGGLVANMVVAADFEETIKNQQKNDFQP